MKMFQAIGINWDCDTPEIDSLPTDAMVEAEDKNSVADALSDKYGWCVDSIESVVDRTVRVKRVVEWTYPTFGNRHTMPYGKLLVTDGVDEKVCRTKGDTPDTWDKHHCQYVTFNRRAYECKTVSDGGVQRLKLEPIK